jgi:NAD(P)-dependent dehydrogenase (short-subunit alcohol dehydrogenase family)
MQARKPVPTPRYPDLENQIAVVAGGVSGIGEAITRVLAANGAQVAFLEVQDDPAAQLADDIAAQGLPRPAYFRCDMMDIDALQATLRNIGTAQGPISILVNDAANDSRQRFEDVTADSFDRSLNVSLRHVFFAAQAVAPQMRQRGCGSIINMSSGAWVGSVVDLQAYSAAKAARRADRFADPPVG